MSIGSAGLAAKWPATSEPNTSTSQLREVSTKAKLVIRRLSRGPDAAPHLCHRTQNHTTGAPESARNTCTNTQPFPSLTAHLQHVRTSVHERLEKMVSSTCVRITLRLSCGARAQPPRRRRPPARRQLQPVVSRLLTSTVRTASRHASSKGRATAPLPTTKERTRLRLQDSKRPHLILTKRRGRAIR